MLVHELMSHDVITLLPETTVVEAARTLLDRDITAAPVVDPQGKLVGIVSRRDLVAGREVDDPRAHLRPVHDESGPRPSRVREVMTGAVLSVTPNEDTVRASRLMVDNGLASLPVVQGSKVVGMLSVTDLLRSHAHTDDP